MIQLTKEEAQQVLDALEKLADETPTTHVRVGKAIAEGKEHVALWFDDSTDPLQQALYLNATKPEKLKPLLKFFRAYLAEPEKEQQPEPVAWMDEVGSLYHHKEYETDIPLYTAQPQREWQGLTDGEIDSIFETKVWDARRSYARAIEAKLKEKNT